MPPFVFPNQSCNRAPLNALTMKTVMSASALFNRSDLAALLLQPPQVQRQPPPPGAEDIFLAVEGASLACRFYASAPDDPTLLYFHGGCESADTFSDEAQSYRQAGLNLFLFSYRGFAGSSGALSLGTILADAEAQVLQALHWLSEKKYTGPTFVVGRSLGSLCAVDVASRHQETLKGLILESSYCQAQPLLANLGLQAAAGDNDTDDSFGMLAKLADIKLATSIFHGSRDQLVPIVQAEKLQAASGAKSKQFMLVPGATHGDVAKSAGHLYFKAIRTFTDTVCGRNTWRERRRQYQGGENGKS